ncbi:hypothetical protein STHAL_33460 [Streptomyces halstedii]|uniref:DUF2637 domain-containing protein n=1 Tax=Streptomyces halstedii TaxID=1944 RepID=A0ABS6U1S6_STRHA|nr:hypothetical protein [Streptomyces halstedii]MBV7674354.1 hypothetical protein [Streptomyces halstedii]
MGRSKVEAAGPPGSSARLRTEMRSADRFISFMTWGVAAGAILWSLLNATPYVAAHLDPDWQQVAFVLPLVVDLAFVGALRADEIASRYGVSGGKWGIALRLFTGASSVFLNVGHSWQRGDATGVAQHLIAPAILVLVAEGGPVYRRRLAAKLAATAREEAEAAETERRRQEAEAEKHRARQRQEEADRRRQAQEDEDRARAQKAEDEARRLAHDREAEDRRANNQLALARLELEGRRIEAAKAPAPAPAGAAPAVAAPATTPPQPGFRTSQPAAPATATPAAAPAATVPASAPQAPARPTTAVAAEAPARPQVSARVPEPQTAPAAPARPLADWQRPDLPASCAPGRRPELLTDAQREARIEYGLSQEDWSQRRIGEFAGRSATVVNRRKKELIG